MTTNQTPGPAGAAHIPPADPGRLPRLVDVVHNAERALALALAELDRDVDSASAPTALVWPEVSDRIRVHDLLLGKARIQVVDVLTTLAAIGELLPSPAEQAVSR